MNKRERNKLNMFRAVELVCSQHQGDWNGLPAFSGRVAEFALKLNALDQAVYNQGVATAGVTAGRDQVLETTIERTLVLAAALRSYADSIGDTNLESQLDFNRTDLRNAGRAVLPLIDRVLNNATLHFENLYDYGVTQTMIDELSALRIELGATIELPRNAIVERSHETQTIRTLFDELDDLLKDHLDRLIEVLKADHGGFYQRYKKARVIIDHKGKKPDALTPEGDGPQDGDAPQDGESMD